MDQVGREKKPHSFRADRVFAVNEGWFFSTRECEEGPYASRLEAEAALRAHIKRMQVGAGFGGQSHPLIDSVQQGFHHLQKLEVDAAWQQLSAVAAEIGLEFHPHLKDTYHCCEQVLQQVEYLHSRDDERFADLPVPLRGYSQRYGALGYPVDGMLVPERVYKNDIPGCGVFYCKISELGEMVAIDTLGHRVEQTLKELPLDASAIVGELIGRLERQARS
jgi:hypothetical protein